MSKRERIGIAVFVTLAALSLLLVWLCRKPAALPESSNAPYYKQIQAQHDSVADTVSKPDEPSHSSHKPYKSHPSQKKQKPTAKPRSPLDEPC